MARPAFSGTAGGGGVTPPQWMIACDFDGTLTRQDTLVEILDRYGSSRWRQVQGRVVSGEISIREGLRLEMGSVQASAVELRDLLSSRIEMDPTFPPFLQSLRLQGIPLVVLTGGFDFCVETVLQKAGLWPLPFLANRLRPVSDTNLTPVSDTGLIRWQVEFPYPSLRCPDCGHCKADPIREWVRQGYTTVFVGNGVTDRCAAEAASLTFAKEELHHWCRQKGIPAVPFENFHDVQTELEKREWL